MCNRHQCVNKESQSLMQIRECEVVPNWVEQLVHEVKVMIIVQNVKVLTYKHIDFHQNF